MDRETIEAYTLGAVGLSRGIWEEYIRPNRNAAAVVAGVVLAGIALGYVLDKAENF